MNPTFLPADYRSRVENSHYLDVPAGLIYQPHVYQAAASMARRAGLRRIVDIGCGNGAKLAPLAAEFEIIGVDCAPALALARVNLPEARLIDCDLERGLPVDIDAQLLREAVVVCADVLEHLRDPDLLCGDLARVAGMAPLVLVSTPDRDRVRGLLDVGPPGNPTHVREWSAGEFARFLRAGGFPEPALSGHTINTDRHRAKSTTLVIGGTYANVPSPAPADFRLAAVIHAYNEADILPEVVRHLTAQGAEVHLFDNWSTDGTFEIARSLHGEGLIHHLGRFPDHPSGTYEWARQLAFTAEYGATTGAHWIMHHDADEIRQAPWRHVTLRDAIAAVDARGFNAIDFTVIDFRFPLSMPDAQPPFSDSLTHFEFGRRPGHFVQIKGWKNAGAVELAASGGHDAQFSGRRVFPLKFLMRHYPLRNREQARRKIFHDRLPRAAAEREQRRWHTQYDEFTHDQEITGWPYHRLLPWNQFMFDSEFLVERLTGIGLVDPL